MKQMLDNDIDNLFKSSLGDVEFKPAAESWKKISLQLQLDNKQEKNILPVWLAAASILIIITLGLKFFTPKEVIRLTGNSTQGFVIMDDIRAVEHKTNIKYLPVEKELSLNEIKRENEKRFLSMLARKGSPSEERKITPKKENLSRRNNFPASFPLNINKDTREEIPHLQDIKLLTITAPDANELVLATETPATNIPDADKESNPSGRKSFINSVGDLVNFVIAKVDGRNQKLFHVSKTEESDMEITQINLGLIKYNKN